MKSRKKILAGMVAMALGSGAAYAATFEGRLACDQDPREAATSCMLYVPVTDTVGLPVYTQQISVTYLLEPRGEAAAGMESEAASSDISASASVSEPFSSEPPLQASVSEELTYPQMEVDEGRPVIESERVAGASSAPARGGLFAWFTGERGSRSTISDQSVAIDAHPGGLVVTESSPGPIQEGDPFVNHQELLASSSGRPGFFSWLTGERRSQSVSDSAAVTEPQSPDQIAITEFSEDTDRS
jgi:hypothetical protein